MRRSDYEALLGVTSRREDDDRHERVAVSGPSARRWYRVLTRPQTTATGESDRHLGD
jgi:hypothetical protein